MPIFADDFTRYDYLIFRPMTKTIFILRHAQSAGKQSGQRDYERVLTASGVNESGTLGKILSDQEFRTDLILASGAVRVRQTIEIINKSLRLPAGQIHFREELYEALMTDWQRIISELPESCTRVLLAGHNPWLSMLVSTFAGRPVDLAPCEMTGFEFNATSWPELKAPGRNILHIIPTKK